MQESSAQGANSQKGKSRCKMVCVLSLFKTCISLVAASFNGADMQALTDCFSSARSVAQLMISMHEHIRNKTAAGSLTLLKPYHIIITGQRNVQLDRCQSCCRMEAPLARAAEGCAASALYQFQSACMIKLSIITVYCHITSCSLCIILLWAVS